jgi:hypothetical protein
MQDSPTISGSSHRRQRASLGTSASGIADSTISFNTYATGITDGSLCLSQFPPPPADLPITPISDRFLPSPARSTFTITPPQFVARSTESGLHSPAQSTFTVASRPSVGPVSACLAPNSRLAHHKIGTSLSCAEYLYRHCTGTCDAPRAHDLCCASAFRTESRSC